MFTKLWLKYILYLLMQMGRKLTYISGQYFLLKSYLLFALENAFFIFYVNMYYIYIYLFFLSTRNKILLVG